MSMVKMVVGKLGHLPTFPELKKNRFKREGNILSTILKIKVVFIYGTIFVSI
jgi:hypothetical protein